MLLPLPHASAYSLARPQPTLRTPFPNPTATEAEIRYEAVPVGSDAVLSLRDIKTGKELRRFALPRTASGSISVAVGSLPAGVYACALLVDGRPVSTQKLFVVR